MSLLLVPVGQFRSDALTHSDRRYFSFRSEAPSEVGQEVRTEVDFGEGEMPARLQRIFQDPSEPIYTEPSLFERSRSLRSVTPSDFGRVLRIPEQPAAANETETERAVL